jgi:predicted dehydrogenase
MQPGISPSFQAAPAQSSGRMAASDTIQIALIGAGGMGMGDTTYALSLGGTKLVAAADIYDGRLIRAKERWGADLFTTRDYREVLARPGVDAVIIATPDHWHSQIAIDALNAGKDVYLEKPMIQRIEDGKPLIEAAAKSGRILQVGSQYVTSVIYAKVNELLRAGAIGTLNMVEAWLDRNTAVGAWQYSIPPDATPANIDWDRFLGRAPRVPFEPVRLFRWRNYQDYGTGVAGDLFVHLLSGLHVATGAMGPSRAYAMGGIRYWKDGRDVPDTMLALYDYPEGPTHPAFNLSLRVNFKSSLPTEEFGFRFVGSEGILYAGNSVRLEKTPRQTEPGYTIETFTKSTQQKFLEEYRQEYPPQTPSADAIQPRSTTEFTLPPGYSAHLEHHRVFFNALRTRTPVVEDALFGMRTAAGALLSNISFSEQRVCHWDSETMTMRKA